MKNIQRNPGSYDHPLLEGWGQEIGTPNFRAQFVLRPQYYFTTNGADMIFAYRYKYPEEKNYISSTNPIKPPPGYENFSMNPPAWHPSGPAFPALSFEQSVAVGKTAFDKLTEKEKEQLMNGLAQTTASPSSTSGNNAPEQKPSYGWLILAGVIALILGSLGVIKFGRK